jgi:hypothetical protein
MISFISAVMVSIGGQTHTAQPIKVTTSEGETMQMQILTTADNIGTFLTAGGTHSYLPFNRIKGLDEEREGGVSVLCVTKIISANVNGIPMLLIW